MKKKGWARALATRIVYEKHLEYTSMPDGFVQDKGTAWVADTISKEARIRSHFSTSRVSS